MVASQNVSCFLRLKGAIKLGILMIIIIFFYEILGQTTSCPEAVYSALVQAAAEEEITRVSNKIISRVSVLHLFLLKGTEDPGCEIW